MGEGTTAALDSRGLLEERRDRQFQLLKNGRQVRGKVPRQWLYATRPIFARVEGPLDEALEEMEEVRLIMDLRPLWPAEVCIEVKLDGYLVTATRGDLRFVEEILLPNNVDLLMKEARFKNGFLELILPRKAVPAHTCRLEKTDRW